MNIFGVCVSWSFNVSGDGRAIGSIGVNVLPYLPDTVVKAASVGCIDDIRLGTRSNVTRWRRSVTASLCMEDSQ